MSKRLSIVKKDNPALAAREDVREVSEDIDKYAALAGFSKSEAGKILVDALTQDACDSILAIMLNYKKLPDIELRGHAATLEARVSLLRSLKNAPTNLELAEAVLTELTK